MKLNHRPCNAPEGRPCTSTGRARNSETTGGIPHLKVGSLWPLRKLPRRWHKACWMPAGGSSAFMLQQSVMWSLSVYLLWTNSLWDKSNPWPVFLTTCKIKLLFKYCKNNKKEEHATESIWLQSLQHLLSGWTFTEKLSWSLCRLLCTLISHSLPE